ncbi:MAG: thiamine phosphate synthase [Arenicellales bacterium]
MQSILIIGGTDPSGAGLSTDIQVAQSLGCSVVPVVTAVTAQRHDTVIDQGLLSAERVAAQLKCIDFTQIQVVKIGMLGNEAIVKTVAEHLPERIQIVLDPVFSASSGGALMTDAGMQALKKWLMPRALITPNIDELSTLSGLTVTDDQSQLAASNALLALGAQAVFAKGGHLKNGRNSTDIYIDVHQQYALSAPCWPDRSNVRGTGCAIATAIACCLSVGASMDDALVMAKGAVNQAIAKAKLDGTAYVATHLGMPQHVRYMPKRHAVDEMPAFNFAPCETSSLGIYPVVDSVEWIKKLEALGVATIQLRIKTGKPADIEQAIQAAIDYCTPRNIRLFINDYWQLAIKYGAYGVHLGQQDIDSADLGAIAKAGLRLGLSSHCWFEVARALAIKPSYLALGPIYATTSKEMTWIPQGVEAVQKWMDLFQGEMPLVAIGGINIERARALKTTGVGAVAMISAITEAKDYAQATRDLLALWVET